MGGPQELLLAISPTLLGKMGWTLSDGETLPSGNIVPFVSETAFLEDLSVPGE